MSNEKTVYQNKPSLLILSFYFLIYALFVILIIYISIEFSQPDLVFGKTLFDSTLIFLIIALIIIIIPILTILTVKEYKNYLKKQSQVSKTIKNLSLEDIFENEIRKKIIEIILEKPGIHTNEILRKLDLAKGQLQWHLDLLINNNIIKMKKLGQYTTFYPKKNDKNFDYRKILISKSETTSRVLNVIKENPGINANMISETLKLSRSSVKYHIDKLIKTKIIFSRNDGNQKKLYQTEKK